MTCSMLQDSADEQRLPVHANGAAMAEKDCSYVSTQFNHDSNLLAKEPITIEQKPLMGSEGAMKPKNKSNSRENLGMEVNYIECEDFSKNVRFNNPRYLGLFYGKFLEAFTFRTFFYRAATYPFFGVYLNMPGHSYTSIYSIFQLFWSLKFFVGMFSDTKPLFGKSRIYYMAIGWLISGLAFAVTLLIPYPESYYTVDGCKLNRTSVQNENAPDSGAIYAFALGIAAFGASMSDCCSDALSVDYTKREPLRRRGRTIAGTLVAANVGAASLYLIIGFGLNSPAFGGTYCDWPITYRHILLFYLLICVLGMFNSLFFVYDFPVCRNAVESSFKAKVEPLAGSVTAALCAIIVAFGISAYQKFLVHKNWVYSYVCLKSFFFSITLLVDALTIFDVVRNQYFYFAEDLADSIHLTIGACILTQVAAEISGFGLEALTFSMFMCNWTVGNIVGRIISNLISAPFKVVDDAIYTNDDREDRLKVFWSVVAVFVFNLISLLAIVFLCPKQKDHIHQLRKQLGTSVTQAKIYVFSFVLVYLLSTAYLILMMNKNTQCLLILGGSGCPACEELSGFDLATNVLLFRC